MQKKVIADTKQHHLFTFQKTATSFNKFWKNFFSYFYYFCYFLLYPAKKPHTRRFGGRWLSAAPLAGKCSWWLTTRCRCPRRLWTPWGELSRSAGSSCPQSLPTRRSLCRTCESLTVMRFWSRMFTHLFFCAQNKVFENLYKVSENFYMLKKNCFQVRIRENFFSVL